MAIIRNYLQAITEQYRAGPAIKNKVTMHDVVLAARRCQCPRVYNKILFLSFRFATDSQKSTQNSTSS